MKSTFLVKNKIKFSLLEKNFENKCWWGFCFGLWDFDQFLAQTFCL